MSEDEIRRYAEEVAHRLEDVLDGDLLAAYVGGSYALGEYLPGRSDADVLAVSGAPQPRDRKLAVVDALRHESLACPARKLELVLYSKAAVRHPRASPAFELNLNTGAHDRLYFTLGPGDDPRHWFLIDLAVVRAHGVAVVGPPAHDLLAPIPRRWLLAALEETVRWHRENEEARPDDAVLNACRAWHYAVEDAWVAKLEAARWARPRARDGDVLRDAVALRLGDRRRRPAPAGVSRFLDAAARAVHDER